MPGLYDPATMRCVIFPDEGDVSVGVSPECDVTVPIHEDGEEGWRKMRGISRLLERTLPYVSGIHAKVTVFDYEDYLLSLGRNGTKVNSVDIGHNDPYILEGGEKISLGGYELYYIKPDLEGNKPNLGLGFPVEKVIDLRSK
jgi:hypothetical protein